ncbi:hypothetical protein F5Y16DRAFT_394941 [Xylariaceae sp. FL0255]|nr:hypothetical protein F5Y16DRAFT_394941 [Xylariaceae sp. FL0255]
MAVTPERSPPASPPRVLDREDATVSNYTHGDGAHDDATTADQRDGALEGDPSTSIQCREDVTSSDVTNAASDHQISRTKLDSLISKFETLEYIDPKEILSFGASKGHKASAIPRATKNLYQTPVGPSHGHEELSYYSGAQIAPSASSYLSTQDQSPMRSNRKSRLPVKSLLKTQDSVRRKLFDNKDALHKLQGVQEDMNQGDEMQSAYDCSHLYLSKPPEHLASVEPWRSGIPMPAADRRKTFEHGYSTSTQPILSACPSNRPQSYQQTSSPFLRSPLSYSTAGGYNVNKSHLSMQETPRRDTGDLASLAMQGGPQAPKRSSFAGFQESSPSSPGPEDSPCAGRVTKALSNCEASCSNVFGGSRHYSIFPTLTPSEMNPHLSKMKNNFGSTALKGKGKAPAHMPAQYQKVEKKFAGGYTAPASIDVNSKGKAVVVDPLPISSHFLKKSYHEASQSNDTSKKEGRIAQPLFADHLDESPSSLKYNDTDTDNGYPSENQAQAPLSSTIVKKGSQVSGSSAGGGNVSQLKLLFEKPDAAVPVPSSLTSNGQFDGPPYASETQLEGPSNAMEPFPSLPTVSSVAPSITTNISVNDFVCQFESYGLTTAGTNGAADEVRPKAESPVKEKIEKFERLSLDTNAGPVPEISKRRSLVGGLQPIQRQGAAFWRKISTSFGRSPKATQPCTTTPIANGFLGGLDGHHTSKPVQEGLGSASPGGANSLQRAMSQQSAAERSRRKHGEWRRRILNRLKGKDTTASTPEESAINAPGSNSKADKGKGKGKGKEKEISS